MLFLFENGAMALFIYIEMFCTANICFVGTIALIAATSFVIILILVTDGLVVATLEGVILSVAVVLASFRRGIAAIGRSAVLIRINTC